MKISYVIVGIFWFLMSLLLGIQLSTWFTTLGDTITSVYPDDFILVLFWIGTLSLYILNLLVIPYFLITTGYKSNA